MLDIVFFFQRISIVYHPSFASTRLLEREREGRERWLGHVCLRDEFVLVVANVVWDREKVVVVTWVRREREGTAHIFPYIPSHLLRCSSTSLALFSSLFHLQEYSMRPWSFPYVGHWCIILLFILFYYFIL